jgi:serine/threonine protein kinase
VNEATPELVGQVLAGTYKIERLLGEGGMGAVYEASHARLRRRFAVKLLYPGIAAKEEIAARFRREALVTSELGHPHIVEVVDFNHTERGAPYIVMELLRGQDLAALLEAEAPLDLPRAAGIILQVASALQAAHQRGIIHRDLKPPNIFLCSEAEYPDFVKVVDFGISKVVGSQSVVTHTQATMGTPSYMAPEQAEGRASEVDARTDVFALSTIFYEMLSGRPPFFGEAIPTMLYKIVHQEPPRLRDLSPEAPMPLEAVLHRAMNKRPEDRHDSMEKFAHELEVVFHELGISLRAAPEPKTQPIIKTSLGEMVTPEVVQQAAASTEAPPAPAQTTLGASAGEVHPTELTPARSRTGLMIAIIGGAGLLLGIGAVVLALTLRENPTQVRSAVAIKPPPTTAKPAVPGPSAPAQAPPTSPTQVKKTNTVKKAPLPKAPSATTPPTRVKGSTRASAPSAAPKNMRRIKVTATDTEVRCTLTWVGNNRSKSSVVPCVFEVEQGSVVTLKVERKRSRPLVQQFAVSRDRLIRVEVNQTLGRVMVTRPGQPATPPKKKSGGWDVF